MTFFQPLTNNLSFLLSQIKNIQDIPEKYYDYADELTPYGIAVRYPNELFLEDHHAEKAITEAGEILDRVIDVIDEEYHRIKK